jgi:hypothetical protein
VGNSPLSGIDPLGLCGDDAPDADVEAYIHQVQGGYHAFWGGVHQVGNALNAGTEFAAAFNPVTSVGIGFNKLGEGNYGQAVFFFLPALGALGGEGGAAAEAEEQVGYRYAGEGEANVAQQTGFVPNTNLRGEPKFVFLSPNRYESAGEAESALQVGQFNPMGATAPPTHVIEVDLSSVRLLYGGNVEGGTGIEVVTEGAPRVRGVRELR